MKTPRDIPSWAYAVAVVLTTVAYGASYVVIKDAMEAVATSWLLAMRFGLAALVLGVAFRRRIVRTIDLGHVLAGVVVGLPEALGFLLQNLGLTQTSPGRNAFLTATYCVMVPFLAWAVERRRPGANNVVAALMCLTGVGLLSLTGRQSLSLGAGDWLTLFSALMYASNMVAVGRLGRAHDAVCLTFLMLATCALVCLGLAALVEVHDEREVQMAVNAGARIIGVNNRNLKDFTVDVENSSRLQSLVPEDILFVAESGVKTGADIEALQEIGVDAVLIGEAMMHAEDKKAKLKELRGCL